MAHCSGCQHPLVFASVELSTREEFRALANTHDIRLFLILPTFFNPEALDADSSLYAITDRGERAVEEWVQFVCPSRQGYRRQYIERIKQLLTDLDPDGLSIDFIRHFVFWEKIYLGAFRGRRPLSSDRSEGHPEYSGAEGIFGGHADGCCVQRNARGGPERTVAGGRFLVVGSARTGS